MLISTLQAKLLKLQLAENDYLRTRIGFHSNTKTNAICLQQSFVKSITRDSALCFA